MKSTINMLERIVDLIKIKLYHLEESAAALRSLLIKVEDKLEEMKYEELEKELAQCK